MNVNFRIAEKQGIFEILIIFKQIDKQVICVFYVFLIFMQIQEIFGRLSIKMAKGRSIQTPISVNAERSL